MKSIIIWFLIGCAVIAQPRSKSFLWELNSVPADTAYNVYLTYRASYDLLVFTRENGNYKAGIESFIEIYKDDEIVKRSGSEQEAVTDQYEETNSSDYFLQGFVKFRLPSGNYKVLPEFELKYTDRKSSLPATQLKLHKSDSTFICDPISVILEKNYKSGYKLANSGGVIPFSTESFGLLLPVKNISDESVTVSIIQQDSLITKLNSNRVFSGSAEILQEESQLAIKPSGSGNGSPGYYLLEGFSRKLAEGKYELKLETAEDTLNAEFEVRWVDKPRSLYNPERAIEQLELIEKDTVIRDLLNNKEEDYSSALNEYWKRYDRTSSTAFNEVMEEFYSRVDTANLEFKSAGADVGSETDRGKIYIKLGRPDNIERTYAENNSVIELWIYSRLNRKFLFQDSSGLGDYILVE